MRLLLAEDERELSYALTSVLEKNNYKIDPVYDGAAALEHIENEVYDGAILDVMMPKADGLTVLKTIREKGNNLPVLILTARAEIEDKVRGLDSGANDYLSKPFDTRELLARIRAMLRIEEAFHTEMLKAGNIQLDCQTLEISSGTGGFRLSGKEFQMMKILMANQGNLVPQQFILDKIWGTAGGAGVETVWIYVSFLRKKLLALHANVWISIAENVGCCLEVMDA